MLFFIFILGRINKFDSCLMSNISKSDKGHSERKTESRKNNEEKLYEQMRFLENNIQLKIEKYCK